MGKLQLLSDRLSIKLDKGRRPYQSIAELDQRRDMLVHGRTQTIDQEVEFSHPDHIEDVDPSLHGLCSDRFLSRAMHDAEEMCDRLQQAAQALYGESEIWSSSAFRGMIGHQGASIIGMPE